MGSKVAQRGGGGEGGEGENLPLLRLAAVAAADTLAYLRAVRHFAWGGTYADSPFFQGRLAARVHTYARALPLVLWSRPHYRSGTFQHDMVKNLRNVALPGTGVPLSLLCTARPLAWALIAFVTPAYALAVAVCAGRLWDVRGALQRFRRNLLSPPPEDWFAFWRANCALASLHSLVTRDVGYAIEDKWTFLQDGERLGVPVTPTIEAATVVVKHRNEEGGLGYQAFGNARAGGDWIIQEGLKNCDYIAKLLPHNAPLSTLRIVTASAGGGGGVEVLSCVWRAGRAGALTDHSSVLFDVDTHTGQILKGASNSHWYMLGVGGAFRALFRPQDGQREHSVTAHPDTLTIITGHRIQDFAAIRRLVEDAHAKMAPGVPLIGWDVGLTEKGALLLEANLSCNFFRGTFDRVRYHEIMDSLFGSLSAGLASV